MTSSRRGLGAQLVSTLQKARYRRWALAVGLVYLVVYLLAIQNVIVSPGTDVSRFVDVPSVQVVPEWTSKIFKQVAAFYYEPVAAIYPVNHVTILVSPMNIGMGLLLGALVGLNVAIALHVVSQARACRRRAFTGLLGALPGFLTGFACCVPTVALVLGAQFTVALVALRSYSFPSHSWHWWRLLHGTHVVRVSSWGRRCRLGCKPVRHRFLRPSRSGLAGAA